MAEVISKLTDAARYPWSRWTNGKPWRAKEGVDFTCTSRGFRASVYSHARRNGLKVRVVAVGEAVEFQFSKT